MPERDVGAAMVSVMNAHSARLSAFGILSVLGASALVALWTSPVLPAAPPVPGTVDPEWVAAATQRPVGAWDGLLLVSGNMRGWYEPCG
jgi:hypothetical protein